MRMSSAARESPVKRHTRKPDVSRRTFLQKAVAGAGGQPANFTDEEWQFGGSDGEIFAAIAEGTSADMEAYAERIPASEIWSLVNYLRTLKR